VVSETFKEICGSGTDANPCGSNPLSECEGGLCTREVDDGSCKMKADGTTNTHCKYISIKFFFFFFYSVLQV